MVSSFRVVIVGGGPAGLLSGIAAASRGFEVSIFEKKEKPNKDNRSFNFIVSERGLNVLEKFDIDLKDSIGIKNIVSHFPGDESMSIDAPRSVSMDRNDLLKAMSKKLKTFNVFTEKSEFEAADFGQKIAYFSHGSERYDLLIGADGSSSSVREHLSLEFPQDMNIYQKMDDKLYKNVKLDPFGLAYLRGYNSDWDNSFHIWKSENADLICPPTKENGLTGVFVNSDGFFNPDDFKEFFSVMYTEDEMEFQRSHPRRQKTVYSSSIGMKSTVLVGESAHSVLASLGQGLPASLESVSVLDYCFGLEKGNICDNYNRLRLNDAHSVCKLSQMGFGGSDRTNRGKASGVLKYLNDPSLSYSEILKFMEKN